MTTLPPKITRQYVASLIAEHNGDLNAVYDEVEAKMREGKKRWYIAECRVCSYDGRLKMPFTRIEDRNTWAATHSKVTVDDNTYTDLKFHNVRVYEEWK